MIFGLDFLSISNLIFEGYKGSKDQVWNRQKIKLENWIKKTKLRNQFRAIEILKYQVDIRGCSQCFPSVFQDFFCFFDVEGVGWFWRQNSNSFEQDTFEGSSKVLIKNGVNDRIQGRVGIAQPKSKSESPAPYTTGWSLVYWEIFTDRADGTDRIHEKEWEPTGYKTSHYKAEN